jgi:Cohesin domain
MRRPPRIAVLIAVLAATAAWVAIDLQRPNPAGTAQSGSQAIARNSSSDSKEPAIPARSTLGKVASDPFSAQSWVLPRKPVAAPPPPAPVAPPLPFRFAGQFYRDSGTEFFVAKGEEIFPVKEGDTLDGEYKVEAVAASEVRFLHIPTGTRQTLQFSALKEEDVIPKVAPAAKAPALASAAPSAKSFGTAQPSNAGIPGKPGPAQLRWEGPASARAGTSFDVSLRVTSGEQIRAAPMQVRFDPAVLESVSVRPGRYFVAPSGNFGYRVNSDGSIFIGVSNQNPSSASDAEMLVLTFKPKRAAAAAEISVASLNLQGATGRTIAYNGLTPFRTTITP